MGEYGMGWVGTGAWDGGWEVNSNIGGTYVLQQFTREFQISLIVWDI